MGGKGMKRDEIGQYGRKRGIVPSLRRGRPISNSFNISKWNEKGVQYPLSRGAALSITNLPTPCKKSLESLKLYDLDRFQQSFTQVFKVLSGGSQENIVYIYSNFNSILLGFLKLFKIGNLMEIFSLKTLKCLIFKTLGFRSKHRFNSY